MLEISLHNLVQKYLKFDQKCAPEMDLLSLNFEIFSSLVLLGSF